MCTIITGDWLKETKVMIAIPRKTWNELKVLKFFVGEPHYHVIDRLIVEHKEKI